MSNLAPLRTLRKGLALKLAEHGMDSEHACAEAQRCLEAGVARTLLNRVLHGAPLPLQTEPVPIPSEIAISPEILSDLYQDFLEHQPAGRRPGGCFYTPAALVDLILEHVFTPETRSVVDPACGGGAFLSGALSRFLKAGIAPADALTRLHGSDLDPHAATLCRIRLALEALAAVESPTEPDWLELQRITQSRIRIGEALLGLEWDRDFDLVIGNPPFISAREMARAGSGEYRKQLSENYESARGAFDLAAPFVELAVKLLRPSGRLGLVIPHKLFAAEYGAPLRELLGRETDSEVLDLSHEKHFPGASAYAQILFAEKGPGIRGQGPGGRTSPPLLAGEGQGGGTLPFPTQSSVLSPQSCSPVAQILSSLESRSVPLGTLCRIRCGTAGFDAARTASRLVEGPSPDAAWPFLVTGSIDRYHILTKPVRYQGKSYQHPFLLDDPDAMTASRRELFSSPKIIMAGMVKRLEAAFDPIGHAMGVNVWGLTDSGGDPFFLLAVINSAVASFYYRERFPEKHLASDFMGINKGNLAQLAIPQVSSELAKRLSELARKTDRESSDAEIDGLLFDYLGFGASESEMVLGRVP